MIVVGIDFSANSAAAAQWAWRREPGGIRFVHAAPPRSELVLRTAAVRTELAPTRDRLREFVDAAGDQRDGQPVPDLVVEPGRPEEVLLAHARDADLLVVGRRGASALSALLAGSVSRSVARRARMPVAVIPPSAAAAPPSRVVVGVDGSDTAALALRWAAGEAERVGCPLVVAYAVPLVPWPPPFGIAPDPGGLDLEHGAALVGEELAKLEAELGHPVSASTVVQFETPGDLLLAHARADDLLVVGERGHSALAGLILGSTSERCISTAPCPVVVVPAE